MSGQSLSTYRDGSPPSVLLVHGPFTDASSWAAVLPLLAGSGTDILAVANPLRGLARDASYVASLARQIDGPVILVGHSYGGAVVTVAGAMAANVVGLVYVAAFALDVGESCVDITRLHPSRFTSELRPSRYPDGGRTAIEFYLRRSAFGEVFAGDLGAAACGVAAASQRPVAATALDEPAAAAAWRSVPSWFLVTGTDRLLRPEAQRFMAARANARTRELDASHAVLLSCPEAVAGIICAAVKSGVSPYPKPLRELTEENL